MDRTEILNQIQDWLKPIRAQMEANQQAMMKNMMSGGGSNITNTLLQKLNGTSTTTTTSTTIDPYEMQQDLQIRGLFQRIKMANISRGQRDSLCSMTRSLAADDRLGAKSISKIFQMVSLMEVAGGNRDDSGFSIFGNKERTVQEEMDWIYKRRAQKDEQEEKLNDLQSSFSIFA